MPHDIRIFRYVNRSGNKFVNVSTGERITYKDKERAYFRLLDSQYIFFKLDGSLFVVAYTDKFYEILSKSERCTLVMLPYSNRIIDILSAKESLERDQRIVFGDKKLEGSIKGILKHKRKGCF